MNLPRSIRSSLLFAFIAFAIAAEQSRAIKPATAATAETAADFFVSPRGRDNWSGRLAEPKPDGSDGPLATVARGEALVRELKLREPQPRTSDRRRDPRRHAIFSTARCCSKPTIPEPSERRSSTGLIRANGPSSAAARGSTVGRSPATAAGKPELPDVKAGKWSFAQLFVDDKRCYRPRLPKHGYYTIAARLPHSPKPEIKGDDRFEFRGADIRSDWANQADIEVMPFLIWSEARLRNRRDRCRPPYGKLHRLRRRRTTAWAALDKGHRYLVENVREALSEPGQWYLDRPAGTLIYIPRPNQKPSDTIVIAPRLEQLVNLVGSRTDGRSSICNSKV